MPAGSRQEPHERGLSGSPRWVLPGGYEAGWVPLSGLSGSASGLRSHTPGPARPEGPQLATMSVGGGILRTGRLLGTGASGETWFLDSLSQETSPHWALGSETQEAALGGTAPT